MSAEMDPSSSSSQVNPTPRESLLLIKQMLEEKTTLSKKQQELLMKIITEDAPLLKRLGR